MFILKNKTTINATDGQSLLIRSWTSNNPKCVILIVHGLGEHSDRYDHFANFFNTKEFNVYAMDLRGHGESEGKRGHTPSYTQLMEDIEQSLIHVRSKHTSLPIFIYGHSLGGNLVTNFILRESTSELKGAIISAPWLKVAFEPPKFKVALGKFMANIYPALVQSSGLNTEHLSRDPEVEQKYINDPLVHGQISAGLFIGGHKAAQWALDNAAKLKLPTLMMHGTKDQLTSAKGTEEFSNKSDSVDLKLWEGFFHELHNEPEKEDVMDYVNKWIQNHLNSDSSDSL